MFKSSKANMVLALVLAIVLWAFVVGQVDPDTTRKISDVPVQFLNEDLLAQDHLAVVDEGEITVDVTVKGPRSDVNKITSNDIIVTADVQNLGKGRNTIKLVVMVPGNVDYVKASEEEIVVTIDDLVSRDYTVEVEYAGDFSSDTEPGEVKVTPEVVTVYGAASTLNEVDHVHATLSVDSLTDQAEVFTKKVTAVDGDEQKVGHVIYSNQEVDIEASMVYTKTVDLFVNYTGTPAEGCELEAFDYPKEVTIKGTRDGVNAITALEGQAINISGITNTTEYDVVLNLPEGVELADESKNIKARAIIKGTESKNFVLDSADVVISNVGTGYTASINHQSLDCVVQGAESVLETIQAADIKLSVDAAGLGVGTHTVDLIYSCSKDISGLTVSPAQVTLVIVAE